MFVAMACLVYDREERIEEGITYGPPFRLAPSGSDIHGHLWITLKRRFFGLTH
jgi:hypothetical protein